MQSIAIIGTAIAGMSAAANLRLHYKLTLYERNNYVGGHTNTVIVKENGRELPIDTGFMVYNEVTYPRLVALFMKLGVKTVSTDMSFGMQDTQSGFTWSSKIRQNWTTLLKPRFLVMLRQIIRFNQLAHQALETKKLDGSLRQFLDQHRFPKSFVDRYLLPMTAAIWSTPHDEMLAFPLGTLLHFLRNHGLLGLNGHYTWRTVSGGSCQYRERLIAPFNYAIRTATPAQSVVEKDGRVYVTDATGKEEAFHAVIIPTHADEALALLRRPTALQRKLLSPFTYSKSDVLLHSDSSVLPANPKQWAAWNYRLDTDADGRKHASTHYWMNQLQRINSNTPYIVSLNAPAGSIREETIHWRTQYTHPVFTRTAIEAQALLPRLNQGRILFAGSYFRYGFHEDALMAGEAASEALLKQSAHEAA